MTFSCLSVGCIEQSYAVGTLATTLRFAHEQWASLTLMLLSITYRE
jgi:hypothetical protein